MPLFLQDFWAWLRSLAPRRASLSGRLLAYTVIFVLVAELLIFLPSVAAFRTQWLKDRVDAAQLASLALEAAPDAMVDGALAEELLANAEVVTVLLQRDGRRQLLLPPSEPVMASVMEDMRDRSLWRSLLETCAVLLAPEGRFIRITATPRLGGGEEIVAVVAEAPLRAELAVYGRRILVNSILISAAAGVLIYLLLSAAFVRPMARLADAMVRFRAAPEDVGRVITPLPGRRDEIGVAERELQALQSDVRQALRQQERLAALGAAVAKINHDLRNVLTSAQLVSDRLAHHSDPKTRAQGERLVRAIGRGVRLAQDVLQYGRAQEPAPQPAPVALRAVLEDAFADAAAAADTPTGLEITIDPQLCVYADPEHVHRIGLNIMRNAVQAMATMRDRPSLMRMEAGPITGEAGAERDGSHILITLSDNGPGIPARAMEGLFTPFAATTRKGGSGLGLNIARELARANGGEVALAHSDEGGACFTVRLPAA